MISWLVIIAGIGFVMMLVLGRRSTLTKSGIDSMSPEALAAEREERLLLRCDILEHRLVTVVAKTGEHLRASATRTRFGANFVDLIDREIGAFLHTAAVGIEKVRNTVKNEDTYDHVIMDAALNRVLEDVETIEILARIREDVVPELTRGIISHVSMLQRVAVAYRADLEKLFILWDGRGIDVEDPLMRIRRLRNAFSANECLLGTQPFQALATLFRQLSFMNELALSVSALVDKQREVVDIRSTDIMRKLTERRMEVDRDLSSRLAVGVVSAQAQWDGIHGSCSTLSNRLSEIQRRMVDVRAICTSPQASLDDAFEAVCDIEIAMKRVEYDLIIVRRVVRRRRTMFASL